MEVISEYGLILKPDIIESVVKNAVSDNYSRSLFPGCGNNLITLLSSCTGETYPINHIGYDDWNNVTAYEEDQLCYHCLVLEPCFFETTCKDLESLVAMVKNEFDTAYLPEDFDFRNNIRHVVGVCKESRCVIFNEL